MSRLTNEQKKKIFELFDKGYGPKEVSEIIKIPRKKVISQRREYLCRKKGLTRHQYNDLLAKKKGYLNYYLYYKNNDSKKLKEKKEDNELQNFIRVLQETKIVGSVYLDKDLEENVYIKIFKYLISNFPKRYTHTHKQIARGIGKENVHCKMKKLKENTRIISYDGKRYSLTFEGIQYELLEENKNIRIIWKPAFQIYEELYH